MHYRGVGAVRGPALKRPTPALQLRQRRQALAAARRRLRRRRYRAPHRRYVTPGELIAAPVRFNLVRGAIGHVVRFLRAVAMRVLTQNRPVRLDFRLTEAFYPAGTILLFAELDRIITLSPLPKPVTLVDPYRRKPREVLKQIGIFELTGDKCELVPAHRDVVFWRAMKGCTASGDEMAELGEVALQVGQRSEQALRVAELWRGVTEAVSNSVEHAYKRPREDGFMGLDGTRWWMFTHLRDGIFTAAVCDLGCGYRATIRENLPVEFVAEMFRRLVGQNLDASAIETAMEFGRTSTRAGNRGKGSRDALSVLEAHGHGEMFILSNTGWLSFEHRPQRPLRVQRGEIEADIHGTIIWWKLPLFASTGD